MIDTNDMRRDFEACCKKQGGINTSRDSTPRANGGSGQYLYACTNQAWWAWQAATERATVSQWQPIATAPKDESVIILGYLPHHRIDRLVYEGRWHSDQLTWTSVNGFLVHNSATHWMPPPKPPAIRQGGAT